LLHFRWAALLAAFMTSGPALARWSLLCDMEWWNMAWNVVAHDFIGQEFTPGETGLRSIELLISEGGSTSVGISLRLDIHLGDPQGAMLGSSASVDLPDGFEGVARFEFSPTLTLTPGQVHLFRIVRTSENGYAMVYGGSDDPCPDTAAWLLGSQVAHSDLLYLIETTDSVSTQETSWSAVRALY